MIIFPIRLFLVFVYFPKISHCPRKNIRFQNYYYYKHNFSQERERKREIFLIFLSDSHVQFSNNDMWLKRQPYKKHNSVCYLK